MVQGLQNRSTAWIITLVAVVVAILAGAARSLNSLRNDAWMVFYGGDSGYYTSIDYDLNEITAASSNLVTVAQRYLPENDIMITAVENSRDMLDYSYYPKERHAAAEKLRAALDDLDAILQAQELDDTDQTYRNKLMAEIRSRYGTIENNSYNQAATEFNRELQRFPAGLLAAITGVRPLELYE